MDQLVRDVRIALRGLRRSPTFTLTAVSILAIGIGMALTMWTIFNAVLLRRLPVQDPGRIVLLRVFDNAGTDVGLGREDVNRIRHESRTLSAISG